MNVGNIFLFNVLYIACFDIYHLPKGHVDPGDSVLAESLHPQPVVSTPVTTCLPFVEGLHVPPFLI